MWTAYGKIKIMSFWRKKTTWCILVLILATVSVAAFFIVKNLNTTDKPVEEPVATIEETPTPEPKPKREPEPEYTGEHGFYIEVNRSQNVVIIYALDPSGNKANILKIFVSSVGKAGSETIVGTFKTSAKFESLYLVGNVWGRYATRIDGRYYFHSVHYFSKGNPFWNDLEYEEYNKLGEGASAGCVRLAIRNAKWIYENIPAGTTVYIYDSDTLPEGIEKPSAIKIDINSPNRGWDPTDQDENNPWGQI